MKILVLAPRFPYPLDKGDKLRLYHQIVELSKQHDIYLFALSHTKVPHENYDHLHTYCKAVDFVRLHWWESAWGILKAFFSGQPLQLGYWSSSRARRAYARWEQQVQPDVLYCQMVRTIPTVATSSARRKILDFQDALSLNTRRRMERSHGLLRWVLKYEYRTLQRVEQQALQSFDATTVIAPADQAALTQAIKQSSNQTITLVPNGVDTDYYDATHYPLPTTHFVCFTGNMAYAPNVDAAHYLVEEVMPLVWKQLPEATVLLAGADPKPSVRALASDKVTVSGRLADIREAYASSQVFVAPMRIGSGLQNKLLEAMSMQLPCVTTPIAATPLGDQPPVLVGDTSKTLADNIVRLLNNDAERKQLATAGLSFVQEHYSWPAAVAPLETILYNQ